MGPLYFLTDRENFSTEIDKNIVKTTPSDKASMCGAPVSSGYR